MSWTNRGAKLQQDYTFRGVAVPANLYVALVTSAVAPSVDTNVLSELTEIAAGNGYTSGGYSLTPGTTDFDSSVENDTLDRGELQVKDVVWTASGGPIPSSGAGARYAVLTTNEGTISTRQIIAFFDLGSAITVSIGQPLTLQNLELRATTV